MLPNEITLEDLKNTGLLREIAPDGPEAKSGAERHNEKIRAKNAKRDVKKTEGTFNNDAVSSSATSTLSREISGGLQPEFVFKAEKNDKKSDSLLSEEIADGLQSELVFDEVSAEWHSCKNGIWKPVTKNRGLKIINEKLHEFLPSGFGLNKLNAIESFLKLYLSIDRWECARHLIPMRNGVLNTQKMTLEPYSAAHKFNWQLPYSYDAGAEISVIRHWLDEVTHGDEETINIIRAFFRITLIGGDLQKFLEIIGPGGSGKSTLIRLLIILVGEGNHVTTDLKNLEANRFESAILYRKRLAIISDSSRYGGEVQVLKNITGGDPLRFEKKNQQQSAPFVYGGTVVIVSNEPIQAADYTSGLARRRLPIAFTKKITDEEKERWRPHGGIENVMKKELSGLLNWTLKMTDDEVNAAIGSINGLSKSQRLHLIETNRLAAWLDDCVVINQNYISLVGKNCPHDEDSKLYPNYLRWCDESNVQAVALQRFSINVLDICEHLKLPVKKLPKGERGARIQGLKIRTRADAYIPTPITQINFELEK